MLIDLRNLLSGAKDDMTVSAPLEMETFRTASILQDKEHDSVGSDDSDF